MRENPFLRAPRFFFISQTSFFIYLIIIKNGRRARVGLTAVGVGAGLGGAGSRAAGGGGRGDEATEAGEGGAGAEGERGKGGAGKDRA